MNTFASRPPAPSMQRLERLTLVGIVASSAAIILASVVLIYAVWSVFRHDGDFTRMMLEQLDIAGLVQDMTGPQLWLATLFWSGLDILGLIMLVQVRALFTGFRANGVFTTQTARRLRRIGWCLFALGPVSILSGLLASITLSLWQSGNEIRATMTIDESDVYAIVVGLVIVCVGHIMLEAARLSQENDAFV